MNRPAERHNVLLITAFLADLALWLRHESAQAGISIAAIAMVHAERRRRCIQEVAWIGVAEAQRLMPYHENLRAVFNQSAAYLQ